MSGHIYRGRVGRCVVLAIAATLIFALALSTTAQADEATSAVKLATSGDATAGKPSENNAQQKRIDQLVRDLGSPRYSARRAAANELRQIGAEAFDTLHAATENSDPEIAASASYLLRQISVRWVQAEDSPTVRALLRQYGQEADGVRQQRIEQLARLPQGAGIGGLCRIARYDRSPLVSRTAALAVIRPSAAKAQRPPIDPALVNQELGSSGRAAAVWLRQYLVQLRDPPASVAAWKPVIEQESARLESNSAETNNEILLGLYWNLADVYRQANDQSSLASALDRMLELAADGSDDTIVNLLVWLTENKSWAALDTFLAKHQSRLEQSKRPLYYAALARAEQGKKDVAEELAKSASEIQAQGSLEGFTTAKDLEEHGQFEWAVREYRRAIDKQPVDSPETILARIYLSGLLQDYLRHKEAADTLERLVKDVQGESRVGQLYAKTREYYNGRLPEPDAIAANYHFYRAEQYTAEKDFSRARGELDLAINFDPTNADVLIAMYRIPEADEKWREGVRKRLNKLTEQFQEEIDQDPSDASPYNQWAWLISNTEGDFQKAIRYSQRSLQLNANGESGAASYLDTLGRCYYAAGDYENAVKYERQAIEKNAYMQVMQRQLALFEKALAEKNAAAKPTAESPK